LISWKVKRPLNTNNKYAFFPGCLIPTRYPHLEYVARLILPQLKIELVDIDEFTCCADPIQFKGTDRLTWLAIAARNICLAEETGLNILTLCNGCVNTLTTANHMLKSESELRDKVNRILVNTGHQFKGEVEVKHFLQAVVDDIGIGGIGNYVKTPLNSLNVATHTGCHLLSPEDVLNFDDPIDPKVLDSLVAALGAEPVDYDLKSLCCGVGFSLSGKLDASSRLLKDKLENMKEYEADCIVVGCPFCYQQFDLGQIAASRKYKFDFKLPVLYYLQILGLAMGYTLTEMQYSAHRIKDDGFEKQLAFEG
jgi:heterodisulfide reductase subunit B